MVLTFQAMLKSHICGFKILSCFNVINEVKFYIFMSLALNS